MSSAKYFYSAVIVKPNDCIDCSMHYANIYCDTALVKSLVISRAKVQVC